MKIQLINPPTNYGIPYKGVANPHLGLLSLSTVLHNEKPEIDVEILNGVNLSMEEIENKINADIIGISTYLLNYENTLKITKIAKSKGKTVILGGPYATTIPETILKNREYVDYIIVGEGEFALLDLVSGKESQEIDNLVYRENREIKTKNPKSYSIDLLPIINYNLIDIEKFWEEFKDRYPEDVFHPIATYSHKGCRWKGKSCCIFCSICEPKIKYKDPKKFWEEISQFVKKYNTNFIKDVGDNITSDPVWLEEFLKNRPKELEHISFFIYARADEFVKPNVISLLDQLNVKVIYIGFESGNQKSLQNMKKRLSIRKNYEALELLSERNIKVFTSFVLGAPEETDESIQDTVTFVQKMKELLQDNLEMITANILVPYPGTIAFDMLIKKCPKYINEDLININELLNDWVENFCNLSGKKTQWFEKLKNVCIELNKLGKDTGQLFNG